MAQQQFGFAFGAARIQTAISLNYVPQWGIKEFLREVLQEMIDVKRKHGCSGGVRWQAGRAIIEDDGPGLKRQDLALGQSGKRGEASLIGQFGEGLKLAALVAARMGRKMTIETVGFTAEPVIVWDPTLQCDVLALDVRDNNRTKGTRVTVEASRQELAEARDLFLEFNKSLKQIAPGIYLPGGKVFINGALATEIPSALFSYNLSGEVKTAQNRDRTSLDMWELKSAVKKLFAQAASIKVAEIYFRRWQEQPDNWPWEYEFQITPPKKAWNKVFRKLFGRKVCIPSPGYPEATLEARTLGFKVLEGIPYSWESILPSIGVLEARTVLGKEKLLAHGRVSKKALMPEERKNLNFARRIARRYFGSLPPIGVAVNLQADGGASAEGGRAILGIWDSTKRRIWLRRSILTDQTKTVGVLFHEVLHAKSGAADATREFEDAWQDLVCAMVFKRPWRKQ